MRNRTLSKQKFPSAASQVFPNKQLTQQIVNFISQFCSTTKQFSRKTANDSQKELKVTKYGKFLRLVNIFLASALLDFGTVERPRRNSSAKYWITICYSGSYYFRSIWGQASFETFISLPPNLFNNTPKCLQWD